MTRGTTRAASPADGPRRTRPFSGAGVAALATATLFFASLAAAQPPEIAAVEEPLDAGWPRVIESEEGVVTVYQPQLDSWDGFALEAHAAVSILEPGSESAVYGVGRFLAATEVDKENRLVTLSEMRIPEARFPSAPGKGAAYHALLQRDVIKRETRHISLDRLEAALAIVEAENRAGLALKHDVPAILFSSRPALLVYVDGRPEYRAEPGTKLERVLNTRVLLLRDAKGRHFLHVFDGWLEALDYAGPWTVARKPPRDLKKVEKAAREQGTADLLAGFSDPETSKDERPSLKKGPVPDIHVVTAPSELIVTEGEANYVPIDGTSLLYVDNTTGHVFKHLGDQQTYVLVSGRWFRAASTAGSWQFVANDALPDDFGAIPDSSPKENVKASVAGTPQAQEALISNSIPQTAAVDRDEARLTPPKIDGEPQLAAIEGTSLQYVVNSPTPIIVVSPTSYYAVENGVWFAARSLPGPWGVATSVPASIYSIPPSSPLHNVTYVKVYRTTPDVVYVGYTPGYYGTCVSHGAVVYGTGYYYTPWIGSAWYGPPVTYGFGASVRYTPWTGWSVGFGYGWSWGSATVSVGWGWGAYPWWGPVGWGSYYYPTSYYPYYRRGGAAVGPYGGAAAWGPGGWAGTTGNVYSRWGSTAAVSRRSGGYNALTGNQWSRQVGTAYNSRTGTLAAGQRASVTNVYTGDYARGARGSAANTRTGGTVSGGRATVGNVRTGSSTTVGGVRGERGGVGRVGDDVYATRDGNVYRSGGGGWEQRTSGGWQSLGSSTRTRSLDRQRSARASGERRHQNYQGQRSRAGHERRGGRRR